MKEPQAMRQLGFAEATIVNAPFGIYVADDVLKMQFVYFTNCRDDIFFAIRFHEHSIG